MKFENYLIPAQEGFFKTDMREENLDLLKQRKTLLVCTTDRQSIFGGIDVKKYIDAYGFKSAVRVRLFENIDCSVNSESLFNYLDPILTSKKIDPGKIIESIVEACDKWSAKTNILVVCTLDTNYFYKDPFARSHPIVVISTGRLRTTINAIVRDRESLQAINKRYNMQSELSRKLPRHYYVRDPTRLTLYHISPAQLKTLTPRITNKPMKNENFGIPRVSAAPTVDECFKAVGIKENQCPVRYYVYKLLLTSEHRVARPDIRLVPDADDTHEHWVLDPVDTKCIGYVDVRYNYKTEKFDYDVHIQ